MDQKQTDVHIKAMLNSPAKFTPAVPVPDWSAPSGSSLAVATTTTSTVQKNPSVINMHIPGSAPNDPQTNITLQNCVATVDLTTTLNLTAINSRTRNSEYNPSKFKGLIMRIREPRTTALIFQSGKMVCTGARNESDALLASKKYAKIIQKLGFNIKFCSFKIQNLVATCDLRFPIRLENLNQMHGQFSSYEPELFPGLIYRMVKPRVVLLIFVNGKLVFTGAKSRNQIKDALNNIFPVLRSFRKN